MNIHQLQKIQNGKGFIAALDQSGGSTPKALKIYGVGEDQYENEEEMFAVVHRMRSRIITDNAFTGDRILGAILFEDTLNREVNGKPTSQYLWEDRNIVPFLKIDKGLAEIDNDVHVMKPMPNLQDLLVKAKENGVFGTKMRSLITKANQEGIAKVVDQQFTIARQIVEADLMPIIEPEVDIKSEEKKEAETILKAEILAHLETISADKQVMLKLSLPTIPNFYKDLVDHPKVLKVVALSGGYEREIANKKTAENNGVIASFSRALTQGLHAKQCEEDFHTMLDKTIQSIYDASNT